MREVELSQIADLTGGSTPKTKVEEYWNGDIVWLSPTDLPEIGEIAYINDSSRKITEEGLNSCSAKLLPPGSVIFSSRASIGKIGINEIPLATNQGFINFICNGKVFNRYLAYVLKYYTEDIVQLSNSTTFKEVSKRAIKDFKIPLPSLSEQKAIVAKLDRAQRLIEIDKKMLVKYDELIQSVFLEMFGEGDGEKVPLSSLFKLNPRKSEISDIDKTMEASFLGMANVGENGSLNLSETKTVEESWKGYTYFKEGDVLFAKITPCMENGKGAIATGLKNELGFGSTEFHVLRPIEGVSRAAWIYHLTHSDKFRVIAKSFMTGSAGQKRVPTHFFDRFKVAKPTIEKQIRFEEIAKEISNDKRRLRSQINKSEELFSSLVQEAFSNDL